MATAATSLLGLALPVTGELSGTWGDTVNVSITALLDTAVAGTTTLSSDSDVTLTTTTLAANQARQAIILWTAGGTVTRTITAPAQSKSYIVINKTSSSQSIKIVGVGPTTGVTIVAGTAAFVVWNGVDFVTASVTSTTGILPVANGGTGLSSGTSGGVLAYTATGTLASSAALAASALVIGGGAGAAPSTTTTGTGVVTALGVNTGTAGAFVVNGGALGTPSSGTVTNLTGTASININGTVGATTASTGAFTTLSATSAILTSYAEIRNDAAALYLENTANTRYWLQQVGGGSTIPNFDISYYNGSTTSTIGRYTSTGLAVTGTLSSTLGANLATSSGSVGVGNSSPQALLHVGSVVEAPGFGTASQMCYVNGTVQPEVLVRETTNDVVVSMFADSTSGAIRTATNHPLIFYTNNTERARINAAGGLAVTGTLSATSSSTQEIATFAHPSTSTTANNGGAIIRIQNTSSTNGNMQSLQFNNASGSASSAIFGYNTDQSTHEGFITFGTRNSAGTFGERARIDSSGNVGIGTTSPAQKLDVGATSDVGISMNNSTSVTSGNRGTIYMLNSANSTVGFIRFGAVTDNSGTDIQFAVRPAGGSLNSTAMKLDSSGNLLVGTTTAGAGAGFPSRIAVDAGAGDVCIFKTSDSTNAFPIRAWNSGTTGDNVWVNFATETSYTSRGSITYNRTGGLIVYGTTSDYRAKDINGPVTNSGALIDSIPVYMGKMKWATQERPMFIAHEVPAYAHTGEKDAVDKDGKPVYQQMDAAALIPVMWAELQSLRARVAQLESKP